MTEAEWLTCDDAVRMMAFLRSDADIRKLQLLGVRLARRSPSSGLGWVPESERRPPSGRPEAEPVARFDRELLNFFWFEVSDALSGGTPSERRVESGLVRDIFGNPFRPITFSPAWRTDTALALATQMYASRDFSAMPILADALQDAGCDSSDILDHCRSLCPHVRGCWVVDMVLGEE